MKPKLRVAAVVAGYLLSALLVLGALPALAVGITHVGVWLPLGAGVLLAVCLLLRRRLAAWRGWRRVILRLAAGGACLFFAAFAAASVWMLTACAASPAPGATVIVAGAQVHGSVPSLTLQERLNAAVRYLNAHPDAVCVVSGGQGPGENEPEAAVMKRVLTAKGIDPTRVLVEDRSLNTYQNMEYSAAIIREKGLSEAVAVVTDGFHQRRCRLFAQAQGLTPGAVNADTPWWLVPCYWWREIFALARAVALGY